MAGDDVTVDAARAAAAFADADAGTGKTVLLSGYALTGADAANYTLIAQPTGITADITKAAITVTPDAGQSKTYGENDPTLTFAVSAAANGESPAFDGTLTRASGKNAGSYAIAIGSLKLADRGAFKADNYTLALAPDTVYFRIDRAPHADVTASRRGHVRQPRFRGPAQSHRRRRRGLSGRCDRYRQRAGRRARRQRQHPPLRLPERTGQRG